MGKRYLVWNKHLGMKSAIIIIAHSRGEAKSLYLSKMKEDSIFINYIDIRTSTLPFQSHEGN